MALHWALDLKYQAFKILARTIAQDVLMNAQIIENIMSKMLGEKNIQERYDF